MRKFTLSLILTMLFISINVYAIDYTLGSSRITISEPGSHSITGTGSGDCTVYIVKESTDLSDAVYDITLSNFYLKAGAWASAIVLENNAESGSMKINFYVEGDNYTSGYNHGGIKAERGAVSVTFTTSAVGKLTCDAQYSGTYALQAASGATFNASIDSLVYGAGVLNNVAMEVNAAMEGAFTAKPLVILLSKELLFEVDGIWYSVSSEAGKTVQVVMGRELYKGDVEIPAAVEYNNISYNVTAIGDNAFLGCKNLTSITLPETVTSIGDNAFKGCTALVGIVIPGSIERIGDHAFSDCTGLEKVKVYWATPGDVTYGDGIFEGVTVSDVELRMPRGTEYLYQEVDTWSGFKVGETPEKIGESNVYWEIVDRILIITGTGDIPDFINSSEQPWASERISITGIEIGEGVTRIGKYNFTDCDKVSAVLLPGTVTGIGGLAFSGCAALPEVTIPQSVSTIDSAAFLGCTALSDLTISEGVVGIGVAAFSGCEGLTAMHIPASVKSIAHSVFAIDALSDITVAAENTIYSSQDGVLYNKDLTALLQYPRGNISTSFTIPEGVTLIGDSAFIGGNKKLTEINIPVTLQEIRPAAFYGCSTLNSINLPESLEIVGDSAFGDCTGLGEVTVNWDIPGTVTYGSGVFGGVVTEDIKLNTPGETKELYEAIDTWQNFDIIGIYSGLEDITTQVKEMYLFATKGGVLIESVKACKVFIYAVNGLLVKEELIAEGKNLVILPSGQYVINAQLILVK